MPTPTDRAGDFAVEREARDDSLPFLTHRGWSERFPRVVHGWTHRGSPEDPFDLRLFTAGDEGPGAATNARRRWNRLREGVGMHCSVHARQVHGATVRAHTDPPAGADPHLVDPCDGHVTAAPGVLLAVATADCVPVLAFDPEARVVGAFHAGWRGAAEGVLGRGLRRMVDLGAERARIRLHLGPAICGACYEVGPEVFEALGAPVPPGPTPIDLRRLLAERAVAAGVDLDSISISAHCTRCTGSNLFSHRGGDAGRQVGFIGIRP